MPFDPTFPPASAPLVSAQFRDQFNGLKELIDAQGQQIIDLIGVVDSLTAELALVPPGKAEIVNSTSVATGELEVQVAANRAIDMKFYRKGPGDADFVEDFINGLTFGASSLAPGIHTVKAAGLNGGGVGPMSEPADVVVS